MNQMTAQTSSRFVLGTLHFALLSQRGIDEILDAFFERGGRWLDTAPLYGHGRVEHAIGAYMQRRRPSVSIATKAGHFTNASDFRNGDSVWSSLEASVDRLATVPAAVCLHEADWATWWKSGAPAGVLLDGVDSGSVMAAEAPGWLALKRFAGLSRARIGMTGNNARPLLMAATATGCDQVTVARQYDLLWKTADRLLDWGCGAATAVWCASPFHQGALFDLDRLRDGAMAEGDREMAAAVARLAAALQRSGETVQQLAIPFLLSDHRVSAVVVGVRTIAELEAAITSAERAVPSAVRVALQSIRLDRPPRPGVATRPEYQ